MQKVSSHKSRETAIAYQHSMHETPLCWRIMSWKSYSIDKLKLYFSVKKRSRKCKNEKNLSGKFKILIISCNFYINEK